MWNGNDAGYMTNRYERWGYVPQEESYRSELTVCNDAATLRWFDVWRSDLCFSIRRRRLSFLAGRRWFPFEITLAERIPSVDKGFTLTVLNVKQNGEYKTIFIFCFVFLLSTFVAWPNIQNVHDLRSKFKKIKPYESCLY